VKVKVKPKIIRAKKRNKTLMAPFLLSRSLRAYSLRELPREGF
jgi:hypothetical protein